MSQISSQSGMFSHWIYYTELVGENEIYTKTFKEKIEYRDCIGLLHGHFTSRNRVPDVFHWCIC